MNADGLTTRGIRGGSIKWSIGFSVVLIVIGILALLAPLIAGVALEVLIAWLLIFAGAGHIALAWHVRGAGAHVLEGLIGLAYILAGIFLLWHPLAGLVGLAIFLGVYLLIKGIFELVAGLSIRAVPGSGWLILDAVISLVLAWLIWRHLPFAAEWVVGTLLGVAILFTGISRLALSLAARKGIPSVAFPLASE